MISVAVFYLLAVICSARRTHALPLYSDTNLEPQAGKTPFYSTELTAGVLMQDDEKKLFLSQQISFRN